MIVSSQSPLYVLPFDTDPEQRRFLEAIRFSMQFIDTAYARIVGRISEHVPGEPFAFGELPSLLLDAWTLLDWAYGTCQRV